MDSLINRRLDSLMHVDILRRIMKEYCSMNVVLCQNITDIDDKIITRSSESKIPFRELAAKYEGILSRITSLE